MAGYKQRAETDGVNFAAALDEATPERRPTRMPRQILVFWTPRRMFGEALRVLKDLRRPQHVLRHVVISIPNIDEPG